ncbi:MAG: haloalkane dehalogenase [Chloroflexota bacterium]
MNVKDEQTQPLIYEDIAFPKLPYPSRWIEVQGSRMHYMETGDPDGTPILLLHGNPTWSYLWRDVIPHLANSGRVIALDLIGMGLSDKPDIDYTFFNHRDYVWAFIEAMNLKNMVLIIHDWGSALGFDYAYHHQDNVQAIAFMEAHVATTPSLDGAPPEAASFIQAVRSHQGKEMLLNQNLFIEKLLPSMIVRQLSKEELDAYRTPFLTPSTRLPLLTWPRQIPIGGEPADVHQMMESYVAWLSDTDMPMLNVYATPGTFMSEATALLLQSQYHNLEIVDVGEGLHFFQEDQPDAVGKSIAEWLHRVVIVK